MLNVFANYYYFFVKIPISYAIGIQEARFAHIKNINKTKQNNRNHTQKRPHKALIYNSITPVI